MRASASPPKQLALVVLIACSLAPLAAAQGIDSPPEATGPIVVDAKDYEALLSALTPEQLEYIISLANERRMAVERNGAIAEIRQGLLYDPDQIDQATVFLSDSPAGTRAESIARISQALAMVDDRLAEAQRLLAQGQADEAVAAARKILDPNQATYLSVATHLLYADALRAAGDGEAAVEAYRDVLIKMPERLSFAAEAGLRAAKTAEETGRFIHAMQLYDYCITNYGLTLSAEEYATAEAELRKLKEIYDAPMDALAGMMGDVHDRLVEADSGIETQAKQDRIVAILEDIIKTAEEQGGGQSDGRGQQSGQNGAAEQRQREAGRDSSRDQGGRPTSPMERGRLVPGRLPKPVRGAHVHATDESGDWANLPPRKREQLQEIARRNMSQRHRRITTKYHQRLTEESSD